MQVTQLAACCALTLCASVAFAQDKQAGGVELTSNTFRPEHRELRDEDLKRLSLPTGFRVEIFARDLGRPRMLAVADDGTVYVSRRGTHDVVALAYQDGKAGSPKTVVEGKSKQEALDSLSAAIHLILEDRREDGLRGLPPEAIRETVTVK